MPASLLLAVACALLVSGCTARQSRDQYSDRLEHAVSTRSDVTEALDRDQLRTAPEYEAASKRIRTSLEELDADPPPRDAEAAHDSMVAGMDGLAALLDRLGRCESLANASTQDRDACREAIGQDVYDEIRNDFSEANTIYRAEGFSLPGLGGADGADDGLGQDPEGGDEL